MSEAPANGSAPPVVPAAEPLSFKIDVSQLRREIEGVLRRHGLVQTLNVNRAGNDVIGSFQLRDACTQSERDIILDARELKGPAGNMAEKL